MTHKITRIGVASQIVTYSDAIETGIHAFGRTLCYSIEIAESAGKPSTKRLLVSIYGD
jgi:hypothetical protein